jgi:MFS family permease
VDSSTTSVPGRLSVIEERLLLLLGLRKLTGGLGADFFRLWLASAVSSLGDGVLLAAGPLLLSSITRDPALVAGAVVVQQMPWILFSLPAGAFADRVNRKAMVAWVSCVRGFVLGVLAVLIITRLDSILVIYALLFVLGICEVLVDNGYSTLVPMAVKKEDLPRAYARLSATFMAANQLIGPAFGAFLFAVVAGLPFALDGVAYLAVMALVFSLRRRYETRQDRPTEKSGMLSDILDGLRWLKNATSVRVLAVMMSVMNLTFMSAFSVLVLLARERLGLTGTGFGVLLAVSGAGGIAGASAVVRIRARLPLSVLLRAGMLVEGGSLIVLGLVRSPFLAGASMMVASFVSTVWGVSAISYRQAVVPSHLQGRVNSVFYTAVLGSSGLGALFGGIIARLTGVSRTFLLAGLVDLVLAGVMWRYLTGANLPEDEPGNPGGGAARADSAPVLEGD